MKITTKWTFGNFQVSAATEVATAEPVGGMAVALMEAGFLQVLQRVPSSRAEKAVVGYDKRPTAFKRASIAYSDETAMKLAEGFGTEVEVSEGVKLKFAITDVSQHVPTDSGATKEATELWTTVQGTKGEDFEAALENLGLDAEDYDDDRGIAACKKYIQAEKAKVKAAMAGMLTRKG